MVTMKKDRKGQAVVLSHTEQKKLDYNRRAWFIRRKYNRLTKDLFNIFEHNNRSINNQSKRVIRLCRLVGTN